MESNNTVSFKIFFQNSDNIRRFRMETRPSYEQFVEFMQKLYSPLYHPELRLQYTDSEGDKIDVTSQLEWHEMFEELKNEKIIKIHVNEGKGPYFKDGPEPVPLYAYTDVVEKKPVDNPETQLLQSRVCACLTELFPGKRILPTHIPSFLEDIVKLIKISETEADLDVDIPRLQKTLFREGYDLIESKEYEKAIKIYKALLILTPEDHVAMYNLACAECLIGNIPEAVSCLEKAIDLGYSNVSHMLNDSDLDNIRDRLSDFVARINSRNVTSIPGINCQEIIPPPVSEPVVPLPNPQEPPKPPSEPTPPVEVVPPVENTPPQQPTKWAAELAVLHDIGYFDDELLITFLERTKGSVEQTVLSLIDM